jgi:hypothetical protein
MNLRNHPAVCFRRTRSWPPVWTKVSEGKHHKKHLHGEVGTLSTAYITNGNRRTCFVTMEYQSETFIGAIMFEDDLFCKQVCSFFNKNIGRPIAAIGGLAL